ncbi:hypothetical protein N3K63_12115 [Microbacterium sp. W1N]|uniref:hypothetical protein n=1 Tax=Microbacterium festucae TaxID=2977531 RepID=UPI0021BFF34D|nr:hypothetical protein [Microbacterium festucae]MCT9821024.1 hypothetical protein [Microbacterium festucae]
MRRTPIGLVIAAVVSGLFFLGGAIVLLTAGPTQTASFGWFAYQPLAAATFVPESLVILTPLAAAAGMFAVAGLVGLGVIGGFLLGRRRPTG